MSLRRLVTSELLTPRLNRLTSILGMEANTNGYAQSVALQSRHCSAVLELAERCGGTLC